MLMSKPFFACAHCDYITQVPTEYLGRTPDCPKCRKPGEVFANRPTLEDIASAANRSNKAKELPSFKEANYTVEYDVEVIREGFLTWFFFGESSISAQKLRATLNQKASTGWELEFQVLETRSFLGIFRREGLVLTFSRKTRSSPKSRTKRSSSESTDFRMTPPV